MRIRNSCRNADRAGAAATELAISAPLILLIVLGCVDFGRYAYAYLAVANAAEAGALYGATNPYTSGSSSNWQSNVRTAAANEMSLFSGFSSTSVSVSTVTESNGDLRVRCTVPYTFQTLVNWPAIPNSMTLQRAVEMRMIR
jgi:Flp pilus assembly protein TadG